MKSENMSRSAILSYVGSASRLWNRLPWLVALLVIPLAWVVVTLWYVVWLFGGFIILLPLRIIGRSIRKRRIEKQRHEELVSR